MFDYIFLEVIFSRDQIFSVLSHAALASEINENAKTLEKPAVSIFNFHLAETHKMMRQLLDDHHKDGGMAVNYEQNFVEIYLEKLIFIL